MAIRQLTFAARLSTTGLALLAADAATVTTAPATAPSPVATTRPDDSLFREVVGTVELAQQAMRAKKPIPSKLPQTSLQKDAARAATTKPTDPVAKLAAELIGKDGFVAVTVKDVHDGHHPPLFIGIDVPEKANHNRDHAYLITGSCENPTATYFTDMQRDWLQQYRKKNQTNEIAGLRASAERAKPAHALYIFSDDPSVRDWRPGTTHLIRATVLDARLIDGGNGYIKACLVLRME